MIIVTYKLVSAKIADRIVVIDQWQVKEVGADEEPMKLGDKCKGMYKSKVQWYIPSTSKTILERSVMIASVITVPLLAVTLLRAPLRRATMEWHV